jgi:hypothetical protein
MATFKELADKLEPRLKLMTNFKIGKTGQSLKERYEQGYSEEYSYSEVIGSSTLSETIDEFEIYLINRFANLKNCDNEQVGGGEMTNSDKYIVYLMYNK